MSRFFPMLGLCLFLCGPVGATTLETTTECEVAQVEFDLADFLAKTCRDRSECCKICDKGKACGNSCINKNYNCSKKQGCACNKKDLCSSALESLLIRPADIRGS